MQIFQYFIEFFCVNRMKESHKLFKKKKSLFNVTEMKRTMRWCEPSSIGMGLGQVLVVHNGAHKKIVKILTHAAVACCTFNNYEYVMRLGMREYGSTEVRGYG